MDEVGLTTKERAILISRIKDFNGAMASATDPVLETSEIFDALKLYALSTGKDLDDLLQRYTRGKEADEARERTRGKYQGSWFTIFELRELDPTDYKIEYDEATEAFTVKRVKGIG